jgi:hypothetical protein
MMMTHLHGSTAIAGIMVYDADQFPAVYRGNTFIGNVVTSRVNRDSLTHKGSSPIGNEEPDFLSTDDPWFRPNQVILGPDGAMWVSDFYNRIIAHYEVPLDHPGRDRERGRIWRIVYKGTADKEPAPIMRDWSKATPQELCDGLADHNLTTRILVMNELVDRCGKDAIEPVREMMKTSHDPFQHRHGLWVLYRLGALDDATLTQATREADAGTRVHAMRVLEDMPKWESQHRALAFEGLKDTDPLVQRCAAAALQQHPSLDSIRPLLALRASVSPADTHLMYVTRMALREQFKLPGAVESLAKSDVSDRDLLNVADVLLAVPTPASADFIASHLDLLSVQGNQDKLMKWVRHASQHVSPDHVDALADAVQKSFASDLDLQIDLFHSIQQGMAQRGAGLSTAMRSWGSALAHRAINDEESKNLPWQNRPIAGAASADSPWGIKERECSDGTRENFIDSIVGGEQLTGELRSKVFTLPKTLSFQLAGHDNRPEDPIGNKNFVRLRDAETDKVLKEAVPPRRDKAKLVKWVLSKFAGS